MIYGYDYDMLQGTLSFLCAQEKIFICHIFFNKIVLDKVINIYFYNKFRAWVILLTRK